MDDMRRILPAIILLLGVAAPSLGQNNSAPPNEPSSWPAAQADQQPASAQNPPPYNPDRNREANVSSSRDTRVDISPPKDDAKNHPFSSSAIAAAEADAEPAADVQEFHPWDPHKAAKDVEVGDFYFKRKNYRAALERYKEALFYKDNDAVATFRLAQCLEKVNQPDEALKNYEGYLKILPQGPFSLEANKSIDRLKAKPETGPSAKK